MPKLFDKSHRCAPNVVHYITLETPIVIPIARPAHHPIVLCTVFFIFKSTHHPTNKKPHECGMAYIFY